MYVLQHTQTGLNNCKEQSLLLLLHTIKSQWFLRSMSLFERLPF